MGKGRRSRLTAKTGDKALYKLRGDPDRYDGGNRSRRKSTLLDYDENMYDVVDDYHNRREEEFMKLEKGDEVTERGTGRQKEDRGDEDDGIVTSRDPVFDLGVGNISSSDEDEDDESDLENKGGEMERLDSSSSEDPSSSDESESDDGNDDDPSARKIENILDWGGNKRSYYYGDSADFEVGQDDDDAELEEEAGKEVQRARYRNMDEADFMEDFDKEEDTGKKGEEKEERRGGTHVSIGLCSGTADSLFGAAGLFKDSVTSSAISHSALRRRNERKRLHAPLSKSERLRLLSKYSPEFLPLVEHYRKTTLRDLTHRIIPVSEQLLRDTTQAEAVGTTEDGASYLRQKQILSVSELLNFVIYLLLKLEDVHGTGDCGLEQNEAFIPDVKNHPVIDRLNDLSDLQRKLRTKVEDPFGLVQQLDSLAKAAALVKEGSNGFPNRVSSDDNEGDEDDGESERIGTRSSDDGVLVEGGEKGKEESEAEEEEEEEGVQRLLNEARFAVRTQDFDDEDVERSGSGDRSALERKARKEAKKRRKKGVGRKTVNVADFGDDDDDDDEKQEGTEDERRRAAGRTLSATVNAITQRQGTAEGRMTMRRAAPEEAADDEDEGQRVQKGLDMMHDWLDDKGDDGGGDEGEQEDIELMDEEDEFYRAAQRRSKAKKESKQSMYAVAPKYPRLEEEVPAERTAGKMIMKNRGLVPHKAKINRNPRVKKREQYRKALIRRKGAVREVRTNEADWYGGEVTGIKTGLSRSRKIGVKNR